MKEHCKYILLSTLLTTLPAGIAMGTQAVSAPAKLPVQVVANHLYYGGNSGALEASGNVVVTEGPQKIESEKFTGNVKEQIYHAPGTVTYTSPSAKLTGDSLSYQGQPTPIVTMKKGEGSLEDRLYVRGQDLSYQMEKGKEKGALTHGMVTTVHAMAWKNPPDYRIEGDSITVIPNQKLTIKEAKFYIRNWHMATVKNYVSYLGKSKSGVSPFSLIPIPTYHSDEGFGLKGGIAWPVGEHGEAFFKYHWYTKVGFKPDIGYAQYFPWGGTSISWRKEKSTINDNNVWVVKRPEWEIHTNQLPIGHSAFSIEGVITAGNWKQGSVMGSHTLQKVTVYHNPIQWGQRVTIKANIGYQHDHYGYSRTSRNMLFWNINTMTKVSDKARLYVDYHEKNYHGITPYTFDTIDYKRYFNYGASYRFDRLNAMEVMFEYNADNHRLEHEDITYIRDLHSFIGKVKYRVKDKGWQITLQAKDF